LEDNILLRKSCLRSCWLTTGGRCSKRIVQVLL